MLKNENIICIASIDWDFLWQQHQSTMSLLAKNGNRILFIENTGVRSPRISDIPRIKKRLTSWLKSTKGFKKERENLYVYSPIILPFPYCRLARYINRHLLLGSLGTWMKAMEFYDPVIWTFLPTPIVLEVAEAIPHKAFVYYCTDNLAATSKAARKIVKYEQRTVRYADVVFAMSRGMTEYFSNFNKNVESIPMGIDVERFTNNGLAKENIAEMENIKKPIIGYIGGVRGSVDQGLIGYLAGRFPDFRFVFIGPIQSDISKIKNVKNIIFMGRKEHGELAGYIRYFDVCIVPYKKDAYTDNISAAKLNEYLVMGKPVISVDLEGIRDFNEENSNIVYIADSYKDFGNLIMKAINEDSEQLRNKRIEIARNNSWNKKMERMSLMIKEAIRKKEEGAALDWQEKFVRIWKEVKRKSLRFVFAVTALWFLMFHSPLLWILADPLKISEEPQKADAIVVFGGGVGETGSPGKSTIERARYASELYKEGYADKIIFSSGYSYIYNDAENMKLFAISMDVPKNDIMLEQKANNAYENVKFSKDILNRYGWDSILLVSSPYNMRRVSLVFNKLARDINIVYVPVRDSQFYDSSKGVKLEQLRAIAHEYLGILYYFFKGYI